MIYSKEKRWKSIFQDLTICSVKPHGPLLILAGAGSGKTTVLINRIANMIYFGDAYTYEDTREHTPAELDFLRAYAAGEVDEAGELSQIVSHGCIVPWNILAITFTNKAANELKDRLERMLGEQGVGYFPLRLRTHTPPRVRTPRL